MDKQETEYQRLIAERYGEYRNSYDDAATFRSLYTDPGEDGHEEEMLEFLKSHPNATFQEVLAYDNSFYVPIEIVPDDEIDSEDDEDERL